MRTFHRTRAADLRSSGNLHPPLFPKEGRASLWKREGGRDIHAPRSKFRISPGAAILLVILSGPGCTARSVYDTLRISQERACDQMMGREREECLKRSGMSYDDYQRQLKEQEERR